MRVRLDALDLTFIAVLAAFVALMTIGLMGSQRLW